MMRHHGGAPAKEEHLLASIIQCVTDSTSNFATCIRKGFDGMGNDVGPALVAPSFIRVLEDDF